MDFFVTDLGANSKLHFYPWNFANLREYLSSFWNYKNTHQHQILMQELQTALSALPLFISNKTQLKMNQITSVHVLFECPGCVQRLQCCKRYLHAGALSPLSASNLYWLRIRFFLGLPGGRRVFGGNTVSLSLRESSESSPSSSSMAGARGSEKSAFNGGIIAFLYVLWYASMV